ncbi:MAG TPA: transglutaminase domain-containing protein [Verrucomicrobiae bacterium]|nr:transglutaminase domain-containing protein [Verrucomicrobiae bacterium]
MKTPPFLLGAALLFWGWQTGYLLVAAPMAVILETARYSSTRWDLSDEDFSRVWTLCSVLFLGASVYAFTSNEGPGRFGQLLQNPTFSNQNSAGVAGARTAIALFRWLPMMFYLFVIAQAYSSREEIPWSTISQISRWRWKSLAKTGRTAQHGRGINVGFPYFGLCLFAASAHPGESSGYFWGLALLLAWTLWRQRSRRFGVVLWIVMVGLVTGFGYMGQRSMGKLQNYLTNLNPELFSSFFRHRTDPTRSQTAIGQIGRIKQSGRIVIRLKPLVGSVPTYLREACYRSFRSPFWLETVPRQNFESVAQEANGTTWILLPEKTNTARVEISCFLDDISPETRNPTRLLPVPERCGRLENLPVYLLRKNNVGSLLAEGPGLVIFDACYGPGAELDAPPNTNIEWSAHSRGMEDSAFLDLNVPIKEERGLDEAILEMHIQGNSPEQKLQAVNAFFQNKFKYSSWLQQTSKRGVTNDTPLTRFLLETRSGHCEYFASATVLLLRRLHIPARYAVGFAVHESSSDGYVVRERDAHAWCVAWNFSTQQWEDFDTTPASWVEEENRRGSPWQRVADFRSWLWFQFSKFRWGQSHLRKYFLYMLAPVLAMLVYQILVRWKRSKNRRKAQGVGGPGAWPGHDSEFYQVERRLAHRGIVREPGEPVSAWLRRATREPQLAGLKDPLQTLLELHYRYRFDPRSLDPRDRVELRQGSDRVLKEIESGGR